MNLCDRGGGSRDVIGPLVLIILKPLFLFFLSQTIHINTVQRRERLFCFVQSIQFVVMEPFLKEDTTETAVNRQTRWPDSVTTFPRSKDLKLGRRAPTCDGIRSTSNSSKRERDPTVVKVGNNKRKNLITIDKFILGYLHVQCEFSVERSPCSLVSSSD